MSVPKRQIAVIGGGPAGMCAAISAARAARQARELSVQEEESESGNVGVRIVLFEKKDRVGKKLLTTGNGRCNISNADMSMHHYHGGNRKWIRNAFGTVTPEEVEGFWHDLGLELVELEEGKKYPMSLQASSVLDTLRFTLERMNVEIVTGAELIQIQRRKGKFILKFKGQEQESSFDRVILAVGGKASPQLGADGAGVNLGKQLNLRSTALRPAIVRLKADSIHLKALAGCKFDGIVTLTDKNAPEVVLQQEKGEILFTADGLSGPPVLKIARLATDPKVHGVVHLNLFPEYTKEKLFRFFLERMDRLAYMTLPEMLGSIMNKRLILPVLKCCNLPVAMACGELSKKQLSVLVSFLQDWSFEKIAAEGWTEAQVTVGGLECGQFSPETMEALNCPGLYCAGEVMDVDGDCGGYNLQWAACSGLIAGKAAGTW